MAKSAFLFLGVLFSLNCFSQANDSAIAKVFYTLKHKRDDNNRDSVYIENMQLLFGKNSSIFRSLDRVSQSEKVKKSLDEQAKNWTGPGLPRTTMPSNLRKVSTEELFQFQQEKKLIIKEYLIVEYLYEDTLETINWKLDPEIKNFEKITCQKATSTFKGRDWVVWFAPDIPFETGPWKLHGLPGLIIEAYDSKKEVQFLFSGFESIKPSESNAIENSILLPKRTIKVSLKDINKLKENMYSNPGAFWEAQTIATKGIVDPEQLAGFSTKKINNPIELPEKK
ncbi:GLPGLI family protein [Pedobacter frigiditerrae]|uniref:GLPGLI family protein n=1 Tax=Pedobacter frigiditerrae TaxID=2530452 RepID=UPI00292DABB4|nr:GLPGLI family protein [Pedobacter frigiditerrae]